MKKTLTLFVTIFLLGVTSLLRPQCYGVVHYDQSATANGLSTFSITTANPNELILIAYNGWFEPGTGPVTVDGNPATHLNTAHTSNDACAEAYCYFAATAGVHNIRFCTETGYNLFNPPNYILNMASAFYVTGTPVLLELRQHHYCRSCQSERKIRELQHHYNCTRRNNLWLICI